MKLKKCKRHSCEWNPEELDECPFCKIYGGLL